MDKEIVELFSAEERKAAGLPGPDPWDVVYNVSTFSLLWLFLSYARLFSVNDELTSVFSPVENERLVSFSCQEKVVKKPQVCREASWGAEYVMMYSSTVSNIKIGIFRDKLVVYGSLFVYTQSPI